MATYTIEVGNHHSMDILHAALQRMDCHISNEQDRLLKLIAECAKHGDDPTELYEELESERRREARLKALNADVMAAVRRYLAEAA